MGPSLRPVVVAGHTCLDIIPGLALNNQAPETLLQPGRLTAVGPALLSTGGAVSNTGLALFRLGLPVRLVGKVGQDPFGDIVLDLYQRLRPSLAGSMLRVADEPTSYTVVINRPGLDRTFLHCAGVNDTFHPDELEDSQLAGAGLLHFGYPTVMRQTYLDGGHALAQLFARARALGLITSLDMALPDPDSEPGRVDWVAFLAEVLPQVDLFLPSLDEIFFMLEKRSLDQPVSGALLAQLSGRCLELGASVVVIKLGNQGLYVRTCAGAECLPPGLLESFVGRELITPCYQVQVVGTTGAGDATIAGFLAGVMQGFELEDVLASAVATGACSVEAPDATSGIPPWEALQARRKGDWTRLPVTVPLPGWKWQSPAQLWIGPHDRSSSS